MYSYPTKKIVYSGREKCDITLPLGGIGTGSANLASNGELRNFEIFTRYGNNTFKDLAFFVIKAEKDGKVCDIRELKTELKKEYADGETELITGKDAGCKTSGIFPCFPDCDFISSYPFGETDFVCEKFPGRVHLCAWNPLIPLNDTDSSIPAALMEYEVTNTTDSDITYTLYGVLTNPFDFSVNEFCKSRNERINYIKLSGSNDNLKKHEKGELCIGVYSGDTGFTEYFPRGERIEVLKSFLNDINEGELIDRKFEPLCDINDTCAISARITLKGGESRKVRFAVSWYVPYISDEVDLLFPETYRSNDLKSLFSDDYNKEKTFRNYYTRYFTGADECVYYCLSQWGRLYQETDAYRQLLFSSTLPMNSIDAFNRSVMDLRSQRYVRNYDGALLDNANSNENKCNLQYLSLSQCFQTMLYLFPNIARISLEVFLKENIEKTKYTTNKERYNSDDTTTSIRNIITLINLVYRYFKLSGNVKWLSEIWNCLIMYFEYVLNNTVIHNRKDSFAGDSIGAMLKAGYEFALAVKDKKYSRKFGELCKSLNVNHETVLKDDEAKFSHTGNEVTENCSLFGSLCDFSIDIYNKFFKFCPDMKFANRGVFRCFVCFDGFMGFVERGVDYVQLNCVKGRIYVRNIELPLSPLKIKCQGVEIGFTRDGNTATLDNDCEVSPGRNLLVIIPAEKN